VPAGSLFVLLSQDCDILHPDFENEPTVEFHIARPVPELDGNLLHAKNPRRLQFKMADAQYEIRIHDRHSAPRTCLLNRIPQEPPLGEDLTRMIVNWTAKRYTRSAFPDAFNERLEASKRQMAKIRDALKREGTVISGIFLQVDPPDEIEPNEIYRIILRLTVREEDLERPGVEDQAIALADVIRKAFAQIDGIEVEDCRFVSEADFSIADLRTAMRWDYDYLSFRDNTAENTAPTNP
jgi:hypothetical protein